MPIFQHILKFFKRTKPPFVNSNTVFLFEPCSKSHSEIIPGYAKYLLDLGFDVSVLVDPDRIDEGLFCRFPKSDKLHINSLNRKQTAAFFKKNGIGEARAIVLTTAGKFADEASYKQEEENLLPNLPYQKKFIHIEHDIKKAVDNNLDTKNLVTLREMDYKGATTTPINPHYFGTHKAHNKSKDTINFITIGALKKKSTDLLLEVIERLEKEGISNFQISFIGKGSLKNIPANIRKYFKCLGQLSFEEMYNAIENSDFYLPLLDPESEKHNRYLTTGTSGSFQLIYGFNIPCLIDEKFAHINRFSPANSIIYKSDSNFYGAMKASILMTECDYQKIKEQLQITSDIFYKESLSNFKRLLDE